MTKIDKKTNLFVYKLANNLFESVAHNIKLIEINKINDNQSEFKVFINNKLQKDFQIGLGHSKYERHLYAKQKIIKNILSEVIKLIDDIELI